MKTSKRKVISSVVTLVLLLSTEVILARAGGGGGGGGGGSSFHGRGGGGHYTNQEIFFYTVIWVISTFGLTILLIHKADRSKFIILWAAKEDRMWNMNKMKFISEAIFIKMQDAWMNRNIEKMKDHISKDLYEDYKEKLAVMKRNKEKNILEYIDVEEVKIISCEDFHDNSKDSFIAYIKGTILDYTISEETNTVIKNTDKKQENFTDTYHFIRNGNKWILNYIDNDVTFFDLLEAKNYKEKVTTTNG